MPETHFSVGMANWSCHLVLDTSLSMALSRLPLSPFEDGPDVDSEIRVTLCDGVPEIAWTHRNVPADLSALFHGVETRRFMPGTDSDSHVYTDIILAGGPALELRDGALRILHPERWSLYVEIVMTLLMLRESSLVGLHAAVCAAGDTALVLVGPSGSGKSTLAYALAAQGADFYDDENAFFDRRDGRLHVNPGRLGLRPGGRSLLASPPEGRLYEAKAGDPKYTVHLPPTRPCPQERALLFFLNGFGSFPTLAPMPGGDAAMRLMHGMGYGNPSILARLDAAAEITTRCPCRRLTVGPPDVTAQMLLAFACETTLRYALKYSL